VIPALLLAVVATGPVNDFKTAFPAASAVESSSGGRLTNASGFEARGLGNSPESAARTFLARYGAAFGIAAREKLVTRGAASSGSPAAVRFERRIDGLPVFDADIVVGVGAENAVILVNTSDVPTRIEGRPRISRTAAVRAAKAAIPDLETRDTPRATRGWHAFVQVIRPVWRVDFVAVRPPGDFRSYVDAATGKVLLRVDLRTNAASSGVVPNRTALDQSPR